MTESEAVRIRAPREREFGACRMLLGADSPSPWTTRQLLAVQDQAPFIVGAASYVAGARFTHQVRIRVVRTHRRLGTGLRLLRHIVESARAAGAVGVVAVAHATTEPDAPTFLARHDFRMVSRVTTVRGTMESAMRIILPLAERLRRSGRVPDDARIVTLADAPRPAVVALYVAELARSPATTPWTLLEHIAAPRFAQSPVLLVGHQLAGFLLCDYTHGQTFGAIPARIVAPDFQGGFVNVVLLEHALRYGWDAGARTFEFDIPQGNADTEKLARRLETDVVRTTDQYFAKTATEHA